MGRRVVALLLAAALGAAYGVGTTWATPSLEGAAQGLPDAPAQMTAPPRTDFKVGRRAEPQRGSWLAPLVLEESSTGAPLAAAGCVMVAAVELALEETGGARSTRGPPRLPDSI